MLAKARQAQERMRESAPQPPEASSGGGRGGAAAAKAEYERLRAEMAADAAEEKRSSSGGGWKWRGKGAKDDDEEDEDDDDDDGGTAAMSELERQRAKYLERKRETFGLTAKQRQDATLQKLQAFKSGLSAKRTAEKAGGGGGGGGGDWMTHGIKYGRGGTMAETARNIEVVDPLDEGGSSARALAKIKEREKAMLSLQGGEH